MLCKGIPNPAPLELLARIRTGDTVQYANLLIESA